MTQTLILWNARQGHEQLIRVWEWIKPKLETGHKVTVTVKEVPRTLPQNDHIQKLVRKIGSTLGCSDHDRLRMLLVEQWRFETSRKPEHTASFDGLRMVDTGNRTSGQDKSEASEFIEWLIATEAGL